jgi:hypothetical protein
LNGEPILDVRLVHPYQALGAPALLGAPPDPDAG